MTADKRHPARWSHVTYASFRNRAGGGGWSIGPSVRADRDDENLVAEYAPTSMRPTVPVDDFIGSSEIADLPRRFEYLPLGDRALFLQSVPAGTDATGRPGNVFTHAVIDHDPDAPLAATYPVNLYRSPDLRTPFRIASVDAVDLPVDLEEPRPGPLSDLTTAWTVVTAMLGDRRGVLHLLQDTLAGGRAMPVLTLRSGNEAAYWLQALSSTLSPAEARRLLRFSTFERAGALPVRLPEQAHAVVVAPVEDKEHLVREESVVVVDPADPGTWRYRPRSTWAQLTRGVLDSGTTPQQMVDLLAADTTASPRHFGDALARVVSRRTGKFGAPLADIASRHLSDGRPADPAGSDPDLLLLRQVIADPSLATRPRRWPVVTGHGAADVAQLTDEALDALVTLGGASTDTLVSYLDFLLHTGIVDASRVQDSSFRDLFSGLRSFRGWKIRPVHAEAHPRLRTLLELAGRDRTARLNAQVPEGEKVLQNLGCGRSIDEITGWLRGPGAAHRLAEVSRQDIIRRSVRDFTPDLLRLYFALCIRMYLSPVVTGDPDKELALLNQLSDLVKTAVDKAAVQGHTAPEHHTHLGRRIARQDILPAGHTPEMLRDMVAEIRTHQDPAAFTGPNRSAREIVAAVARGIVEETAAAAQERGETHA